VHTEPDVLLVDEVLSVGDIRFIGRCREKIDELRRKGTSMILVSHSLALIEESCDRGVVMRHGRCVMQSNTRAATAAYRQMVRDEAAGETAHEPTSSVRFVAGELFAQNGQPTDSLECGEAANLELLISTKGEVKSGYLCLWAMDEDSEQVTGVGYLAVGRDLQPLTSGSINLRFHAHMMPGRYRLGATFSVDGAYNLVDEFLACRFTVRQWQDLPFKPTGTFRLDVQQAAKSLSMGSM